jgi:hypothetical protein
MHQPKGMPLRLAFRQWTHPRLISRLDNLEARAVAQPDDVQLQKEAKTFRSKLEFDFVAALRAKNTQFSVIGTSFPFMPMSERGETSWDVIRDMDCWKFDTSEAWFGAPDGGERGVHLVDVEVFGPIPEWEVERLSRSTATPLERNEAVPLHLSDDHATLTVSGKPFIFRGQKQQRILRQLFDAYKSGAKLRTILVLEKAQVKADSLRKAFNKSPHWPVLERIIHREQGYCWFDIPVNSSVFPT